MADKIMTTLVPAASAVLLPPASAAPATTPPAATTTTTTTTTATTTTIKKKTTKTEWVTPSGNKLRNLGALICICAALSMGAGIADIIITAMQFRCPSSCTSLPYIFTWVASGVWGSFPAFITGMIAILIKKHPAKTLMRFKAVCIFSVLITTPGMVIISALEWNLGGMTALTPPWYTLSYTSLTLTFGSSPFGYVKFALPVGVSGLGVIEFLTMAITLVYATVKVKRKTVETITEEKIPIPVQPPKPAEVPKPVEVPPPPKPVEVPAPPPPVQEPIVYDDYLPDPPHPRAIPYYYPVPVPRPVPVPIQRPVAVYPQPVAYIPNTTPTYTINPYPTNPYYNNYAVNPSVVANPYPTAPAAGTSYIATAGQAYITPQPAYAYFKRRH